MKHHYFRVIALLSVTLSVACRYPEEPAKPKNERNPVTHPGAANARHTADAGAGSTASPTGAARSAAPQGRVLAQVEDTVKQLAVDDDSIYWLETRYLDSDDGEESAVVQRVATTGGPVETMAVIPADHGWPSMAVSGGVVYVGASLPRTRADRRNRKPYSVGLFRVSAGKLVKFATVEGAIVGELVIVEGAAYFEARYPTGSGHVMRVELATGAAQTLVKCVEQEDSESRCGQLMSQRGPLVLHLDGRVDWVSRGGLQRLSVPADAEKSSLLVAARHLWISSEQGWTVQPLDGGSNRSIAGISDEPRGDGNFLYHTRGKQLLRRRGIDGADEVVATAKSSEDSWGWPWAVAGRHLAWHDEKGALRYQKLP